MCLSLQHNIIHKGLKIFEVELKVKSEEVNCTSNSNICYVKCRKTQKNIKITAKKCYYCQNSFSMEGAENVII